jgi:general bacterial porin, GBP family
MRLVLRATGPGGTARATHPIGAHMHNALRMLALAASVLATAAQAQSSVTLFGVVDLGYLDSSPNAVPGRAATPATTRGIEDGIQTPSRFGLQGVESLGGGLNARFWLEGGFAADTGTSQQGGRLFGRQAWASLQGAMGELRLGRQYGVGYDYYITGVSPFGTTFRDAGLGNVFSSASGRLILDNMVEYRTPALAGFSGAVGYAFNAAAAEVAGNSNNTSVLTAGAQYRRGPVVAVVSYESINCPASTATIVSNTCNAQRKDDQTHLQVGGSFDFKVVKVYGAYAKEENQFTLAAITPSKDAAVWMLGASAPLAGGEVLAAYSRRDDKAYGADLNVWGIGYTYPLSIRTNLYAFYADTTADSAPSAQASAGGAITAEGYTAAQIGTYWDRNRTQFGVGVRHRF